MDRDVCLGSATGQLGFSGCGLVCPACMMCNEVRTSDLPAQYSSREKCVLLPHFQPAVLQEISRAKDLQVALA
jgi:hypothetical protein